LHQVGDLFELNVKFWCQKFNVHINTTSNLHQALPSDRVPLGVATFSMSLSKSVILLEIGASERGSGAQ